MREKLSEIYAMTSMLTVSGDAVDIVAAIRNNLRKLIKEEEGKSDGEQDDR